MCSFKNMKVNWLFAPHTDIMGPSQSPECAMAVEAGARAAGYAVMQHAVSRLALPCLSPCSSSTHRGSEARLSVSLEAASAYSPQHTAWQTLCRPHTAEVLSRRPRLGSATTHASGRPAIPRAVRDRWCPGWRLYAKEKRCEGRRGGEAIDQYLPFAPVQQSQLGVCESVRARVCVCVCVQAANHAESRRRS